MPLLESPPNFNRPRRSCRTPAKYSSSFSPERNPRIKTPSTKRRGSRVGKEDTDEEGRTQKSHSASDRKMQGAQMQTNPQRSDSSECDEINITGSLTCEQRVKKNERELHYESDAKPRATQSLNQSNKSSSKKITSPRKEKSTTTEAELRQYSPVTPTKQKKGSENDETFKSPPTPSHLLDKLSLKSPQKFEPKKLFNDGNAYRNARRALHGTFTSRMPGREAELIELRCFIETHLATKESGTLYISGPPGTGKTALLSTILSENDFASEFRQVYINCTAVKSSGSIFAKIVKELECKSVGKSEKECVASIENYLSRSHKMILLVLDEIDQLESKKQSILYKIFEWPSKPNSKLILIGIANALDLTDRVLPRLQAHCELKPRLMHFAPYTKEQIVQIFTLRLQEAGVLDVFSPGAIQMLAGKVAAVSGDVRRALDIGRRVVELVEQKSKSEVLKSLENLAEDDAKPIDEAKSKCVDLMQIVNVLNKVYGTTNNLSESGDDLFPLQQKIVMCTLLLILKKARNKDVTIGKLHEVYRKVCVKRNLLAVDQAEFVGICSLIETKGILRVTGKREPRLHKVALNWDQDEIAGVLGDKQLMSSILQDDSCLGKL